MSTSDLKIDLINKITNITDENQLLEILKLIEFQSETVFKTSEEDKKAIAEARKQTVRGDSFTNEEIQKDILDWLGK